MAEPVARTGTVAVAGGKGGSGKTTATLGCCAALAARGRRPVAVDADVALPDLHIRAGVPLDPGLAAVSDGRPAAVARASDRVPGVDVLPAGSGPVDVGRALATAARMARPVVIDCPAGAGPDAAAPLRVADATILVCSTTPQSRRDGGKTARMARALGAPPVARVERDRPGGASAAARDVPTVTVPTVDGEPLTAGPVRAGFDHLVGVAFDA